MPSSGTGAGVIASAEVATATTKPAAAINLIIVFLLCFPLPQWINYPRSRERWLNEPLLLDRLEENACPT